MLIARQYLISRLSSGSFICYYMLYVMLYIRFLKVIQSIPFSGLSINKTAVFVGYTMFRHRLSGTMLRTRGIQPLQPHTLQQVVGLQGQGAPSIAKKNTEFLVIKRGWGVFHLYVLFFLLKPPIVGKLLDYQRANRSQFTSVSLGMIRFLWNSQNLMTVPGGQTSEHGVNQRRTRILVDPMTMTSDLSRVDSRWTNQLLRNFPMGVLGK